MAIDMTMLYNVYYYSTMHDLVFFRVIKVKVKECLAKFLGRQHEMLVPFHAAS